MENAYETGPFLQVSARFRSSNFKLDIGFRNVNRRSSSRQEFRNFGSPICLIPDRLLGAGTLTAPLLRVVNPKRQTPPPTERNLPSRSRASRSSKKLGGF